MQIQLQYSDGRYFEHFFGLISLSKKQVELTGMAEVECPLFSTPECNRISINNGVQLCFLSADGTKTSVQNRYRTPNENLIRYTLLFYLILYHFYSHKGVTRKKLKCLYIHDIATLVS